MRTRNGGRRCGSGMMSMMMTMTSILICSAVIPMMISGALMMTTPGSSTTVGIVLLSVSGFVLLAGIVVTIVLCVCIKKAQQRERIHPMQQTPNVAYVNPGRPAVNPYWSQPLQQPQTVFNTYPVQPPPYLNSPPPNYGQLGYNTQYSTTPASTFPPKTTLGAPTKGQPMMVSPRPPSTSIQTANPGGYPIAVHQRNSTSQQMARANTTSTATSQGSELTRTDTSSTTISQRSEPRLTRTLTTLSRNQRPRRDDDLPAPD